MVPHIVNFFLKNQSSLKFFSSVTHDSLEETEVMQTESKETGINNQCCYKCLDVKIPQAKEKQLQ